METVLFWHRRDLRMNDNAGLFKALKNGKSVQPVFIFDTTILRFLPKNDQRVRFIHEWILKLKKDYAKYNCDLLVKVGDPREIIPALVKELKATAVFTNRDYEPEAIARDKKVGEELSKLNCDFIGAKDQVIFEKSEIVKADNAPYTVYTPYSKRWKEKLNDFYLKAYPVEKYVSNLKKGEKSEIPTLKELGFNDQAEPAYPADKQEFPSDVIPEKIISNYHNTRDLPYVPGTSRLSVHLRFGTISIRELAKVALMKNEKFLNELIWRDFYQMILFHFPYIVEGAFKKNYDKITWEFDEKLWHAWREGKTGYPLVDAGMRELNETGFMHNRVRMVVASFLTKHLLHDWRLGERYFAEKLLDFDLASNIGGWQWAMGGGNDAAPYFRVFNPTSQQQKFDPNFEYIKHWVPEFGTDEYPLPIVEHTFARNRVLERYKKALSEIEN